MALNLSDYLKMLTEPSYRPKARLTFLRMEDESPYDIITGDILDGNIQITRNNGVRRSCSLTLKNDDGKYIPNPYNIWVNRKFFLEVGLEKETYVDQTVWENDTDGEEVKEAGRFDNTVSELQEGVLTNVFVDSNGLQLVANESEGNRVSPDVSLSEIKNVDSSLIEWVATTPQGTVGEEVLTQVQFEQGVLTDVVYNTRTEPSLETFGLSTTLEELENEF